MGKRIEYLDLLKFFAIFCVLLGHSTEQISADLFWDHPIWSFIYSYHMPLFIFLSGFFFKSSLRKPYLKVLGDKAVQLLVPSVTAFAIGVVLMLAMGTKAIADLCELSFSGFMNSVWFLKCLFMCIAVMYPLCKLFRKDWVAAMVATVAVIFIPGLDIVNFNFMLPMFALGMLCGGNMECLEKHWKMLTLVSIAVFAALLPFWSGRMTVYMVPTRVIADGALDLHNLGITVYRLAIGMAGTLTFFFLSRPVYGAVKDRRWCPALCRIGGATLGIYVLQTFFLEILINRLHVFIPLPWSCLAAPVIAVSELALCYGLVLLLRRSRTASLLLLGQRPASVAVKPQALALIPLLLLSSPDAFSADMGGYRDSLRVKGENNHVQGIAYDKAEKCFYCSFTTAFYKVDLDGNIVASIDDIHGHLGAMTFDESSRRVYASLEYKDDEIGRGISKGMGVEAYSRDETRFYIAEIDVDSMSMTTHELPLVREDYMAGRYACSGIDGVTIAPAFGRKGKSGRFLYVAYGVYGDVDRTDNDYNILLCYRLGDFSSPVRRYFIHTGNTTYGVQNLAYDPWTDRMYMAVYRGRKPQYPNYGIFGLDMGQKPGKAALEGVPYQKGRVWQLCSFTGWQQGKGSTGLCSLGDGFFYVGESGKEDGRQFCDFKLYRLEDSHDVLLVR